jgi:hypothetical protein
MSTVIHSKTSHAANCILPDAGHWIETLHDGTRVLIRPIHVEDREREEDLINRLSPESRRFRLLGTFKEASPVLINQLVNIDYRHQMAFVALVHDNGKLRESA